mmetsp:Transcript_24306/g.56218  ORF Transcript_24306/g.56218 Transcript_24306/m.56218 type:complete len:569 (+) Transcript_24306:284-1990(+)
MRRQRRRRRRLGRRRLRRLRLRLRLRRLPSHPPPPIPPPTSRWWQQQQQPPLPPPQSLQQQQWLAPLPWTCKGAAQPGSDWTHRAGSEGTHWRGAENVAPQFPRVSLQPGSHPGSEGTRSAGFGGDAGLLQMPPQQQQQQLGHGQQMPQQGQGQQQQQGQREGPQLQQAPLQQGQPQPQPQGQPKAVHDAQRRVSFGGAQTDQWGAPLAPSTAVHPSVALHPAVMAAAATQEQQRTSPFPPNPGDARPGSAGFRAAQRSPPGRFGQSGPTVDPRGAGFGGGAQAGFRGVAQSWAQGQAGPLQMPPPPQQQQQQQWQQQTPLRQRRISFYTDFLLFPARTAAVTVGSDTPGAPPTPVAQDPFRATVRPYAETPGSSSADSTPVRPKHRRLRRTVVMSQSPASAQPLAPVQQARQRGAGGGAHRRPPQPSAGGNARGFIEDEADVSGDEHGGEDESEEETTGEDENISQLINNNATPDDGGARWRYLRGQLEVDPSPACQLPTPVRVARYRAELRYNVNDTPPDYDFEQDGRRVRRRGLAEAEDSQSCSLDSFICDDDEPVIYSGTSPVS